MIYQYGINIEGIQDFSGMGALWDCISEERKIRIEKSHVVKDKIRCLFAESLLRYILKKQYGFSNREIQIASTPHGKPYLQNCEHIFFNVSHAGEWVVCAVGDSPIGVDVEYIQECHLPCAYRLFSEYEIQLLEKHSGLEQVELFYKIWTLKESYVKKIGLGLRCALETFHFETHHNIIQLYHRDQMDSTLSFLSRKIDAMHWYALCTEKDAKIHGFQNVSVEEIS